MKSGINKIRIRILYGLVYDLHLHDKAQRATLCSCSMTYIGREMLIIVQETCSVTMKEKIML
jgi:hypothetical protein